MLLVVFVKEHINTTPGAPPHYSAHTPEMSITHYDVLDYCEDKHITFTRARTHRKNDQAHVEEKNGSVVRRLVGYDRFEGRKAWEALAQLYRVLRM